MTQVRKTATYRVVTDSGGGRIFRFYCDISSELCCVSKPIRADTEEAALEMAWEQEGKWEFNLFAFLVGYTDGTFGPERDITRAEVAAVTCRLLKRSADQSNIRSHLKELRTFSDMTESHWAYWYAMEAANGHDYTKSGGSENWSRTYR